MRYLRVKNWEKYQHYKNRRPPWIKLHAALLNDLDFMMLAPASKCLLMLAWILASESNDGVVEFNIDVIAFRLRWNRLSENDFIPLINKGFLSLHEGHASNCLQVLASATESLSERETETEREAEIVSSPVGDSTRRDDSIFDFPIKGGKTAPIPASKFDEWQTTFADMDVMDEIRKAAQWCRDHTDRQKTARGLFAFIGSWLSRSNDSGKYPKLIRTAVYLPVAARSDPKPIQDPPAPPEAALRSYEWESIRDRMGGVIEPEGYATYILQLRCGGYDPPRAIWLGAESDFITKMALRSYEKDIRDFAGVEDIFILRSDNANQ